MFGLAPCPGISRPACFRDRQRLAGRLGRTAGFLVRLAEPRRAGGDLSKAWSIGRGTTLHRRFHTASSMPLEPLAAAPEGCRVTLIRSPANLGFAGGCNVGMRAAGLDNFEFFWLLNTDTVVHRESLSRLVQAALARPGRSACGVPPSATTIARTSYRQWPEPGWTLIRYIASHRRRPSGRRHTSRWAARRTRPRVRHGCVHVVTRPFIADIGPMQEDYFLYFEEMDWAVESGRTVRIWLRSAESCVPQIRRQ